MIEFSTLAGLAQHLIKDSVGGFVQVREGLEAAAQLLEREAKAELGTYQQGAGAFADWAELAPSTKAGRMAAGYTENDPLYASGELHDSITHETEPWDAVIGTPEEKMFWIENGTSRMPPRSVFGLALERNTPRVLQMIGSAAAHGLMGEMVIPTAEYLLAGLNQP